MPNADEKASGARLQLQAAPNYLREGDVLVG